jgi:putative peptidoglycan lipid II flippase
VLLAVVRRRAGAAALAGLPRAMLAGLLAAGLAAAAGIGAGRLVGDATPGVAAALGQGMLSGAVILVVFLGVVYAVDRRDVRPLLAGLARRTVRRDQGRTG